MVLGKQLLKLVALFSVLSLLLAFGSGCSTSKEAMAAPAKTTAVAPPAAPAPAVDQQRCEALMKRVESAASLAEAAAKKADLASQKAEIAADRAEKAAMRAESAANKAESIFKKKLKK
jgi:hypothetical protein